MTREHTFVWAPWQEGCPQLTQRQHAGCQVGSCQVAEQVGVVRIALKVIARNEILDPLLNELEVWLEHAGELLHHLQDELQKVVEARVSKSHSRVKAGLVTRKEHYLLVLQLLSALHRSDNCCINGIAAVLVHVLDHLLLFVHHRQGDLSTGANLSGRILRQSTGTSGRRCGEARHRR